MENNKVNVKIFGQEYTIAGDKPREHIIRVADYVDETMKKISSGFSAGPVSELAVLSAVNIADELFAGETAVEEMRVKNEQLEKDAQHYVQLWEEAKKSFLHYKDEAQFAAEAKEVLQRKVDEQRMELEAKDGSLSALEEKLEALERKNEGLTARLHEQEEGTNSTAEQIREMEEKYKEIESSFFDLQMENIQLKGEIERYKKIME